MLTNVNESASGVRGAQQGRGRLSTGSPRHWNSFTLMTPRCEPGRYSLAKLRSKVDMINRELTAARQPPAPPKSKSVFSMPVKDLGLVVLNAERRANKIAAIQKLKASTPSQTLIPTPKTSAPNRFFLTQEPPQKVPKCRYVKLYQSSGFRVVPQMSNCQAEITKFYEHYKALKDHRMREIHEKVKIPSKPFALLQLNRKRRIEASEAEPAVWKIGK